MAEDAARSRAAERTVMRDLHNVSARDLSIEQPNRHRSIEGSRDPLPLVDSVWQVQLVARPAVVLLDRVA